MAHSLNSPSSFSRRMACPGSGRLEKLIPDTESVYAAGGTAAHNLAELCLLNDRKPESYLGEKMGEFEYPDGRIEEFLVDGEMVDCVNIYANYCKPMMGDRVYMVETRFDLPFIGEDESGTADFVSLHDNVLHVVDYKHGQGVAVEAYENIQGLCYGLGAALQFHNHEWDTLQITIVQPRAPHHKGPIRHWSVPRDELFEWKMTLSEASVNTRDEEAPLRAGSGCNFCKAKPRCKGLKNFVEEVTGMDFNNENTEPKSVDFLSDEETVEIWSKHLPTIEKWIGGIKDRVQKRAQEGNPIKGTKLVQGRERRVWANEAAAKEQFKDIEGAFELKFKTAPQMEKLLGKTEFAKFADEFVTKQSSGLTVVLESDPRPNARVSGEEEFNF